MIKVGEVLVSDEIKEVEFMCHLEKCKGACCVEGDLGAPLDLEELTLIDQIQQAIEPYLTVAGLKAIAKQGPYLFDSDGEYSTPTIEGKECAYSKYDEKGMIKCGIEQAYLEGKTNFRKPISCHLYPIRVTKNNNLEALNYHKWDICNHACSLGKSNKVPLYKFLKEPLIRKYGSDWYNDFIKLIEKD